MGQIMSSPDLKVIGRIDPPEYKDPVKMLRNLADDIEAGDFGEVTSIAITTFGDAGLHAFGGGQDSEAPTVALMFQAASMKMCQPLLDFESIV